MVVSTNTLDDAPDSYEYWMVQSFFQSSAPSQKKLYGCNSHLSTIYISCLNHIIIASTILIRSNYSVSYFKKLNSYHIEKKSWLFHPIYWSTHLILNDSTTTRWKATLNSNTNQQLVVPANKLGSALESKDLNGTSNFFLNVQMVI